MELKEMNARELQEAICAIKGRILEATETDQILALSKELRAASEAKAKVEVAAEKEKTERVALEAISGPLSEFLIPAVVELAGKPLDFNYNLKSGKMTFSVDLEGAPELKDATFANVSIVWDEEKSQYGIELPKTATRSSGGKRSGGTTSPFTSGVYTLKDEMVEDVTEFKVVANGRTEIFVSVGEDVDIRMSMVDFLLNHTKIKPDRDDPKRPWGWPAKKLLPVCSKVRDFTPEEEEALKR